MAILDKVRQWIDGESSELVLEKAARDAQVKPRSQAEEFIVKIARAVESVMQAELLPLPQGTVIIPSEYIVFLSTDDDSEWKGVKRKGLEQGLYHILAERAREIAGKRKLETRTFIIELRIDATLGKGEVRVEHTWEDTDGSKTGVLPRASVPMPARSAVPPAAATSPNIPLKMTSPTDSTASSGISSALVSEEDDEFTRVRPRQAPLFVLEVWRGNAKQSSIPVYKNEIVIGRGSRSKPVDIPLAGDVEVSRRHLTVSADGNGSFWMISEGKNPVVLGGREVPNGLRTAVKPGIPIQVCSYSLRVVV
ncbi:MAG: hypothetical protein IPM50_00370 [Acidobacteriota bacterium]|nr:MAG: hypothetical protein IPM50_00370 [Acidobacteriota bacterium]